MKGLGIAALSALVLAGAGCGETTVKDACIYKHGLVTFSPSIEERANCDEQERRDAIKSQEGQETTMNEERAARLLAKEHEAEGK